MQDTTAAQLANLVWLCDRCCLKKIVHQESHGGCRCRGLRQDWVLQAFVMDPRRQGHASLPSPLHHAKWRRRSHIWEDIWGLQTTGQQTGTCSWQRQGQPCPHANQHVYSRLVCKSVILRRAGRRSRPRVLCNIPLSKIICQSPWVVPYGGILRRCLR